MNALEIRAAEGHIAAPLIGDYSLAHHATHDTQHLVVKEKVRSEARARKGHAEKVPAAKRAWGESGGAGRGSVRGRGSCGRRGAPARTRLDRHRSRAGQNEPGVCNSPGTESRRSCFASPPVCGARAPPVSQTSLFHTTLHERAKNCLHARRRRVASPGV